MLVAGASFPANNEENTAGKNGSLMDENTNRIYTEILKSELKTALGCTEPIAIAYCVAYAKRVLGKTPDHCDVYCTGSMIKNASAVTVPQTGGLRGIEAAALAGLFGGDAEQELEVLSAITDNDRKQIQAAMGTGLVCVHLQEHEVPLRVEAVLTAGGDTASAEVIHTHTGLGTVQRNGTVLSQTSKESAEDDEAKFKSLNIRDILAYADTVELSQVEELLKKQISQNRQIAGEGLQRDWGARVGKTILAQSGSDLRARAIAVAAAGSDARMNGCALPVVINGGSGNQGLTVSLPVLAFAEAKSASEEQLLRALCVSNLVSLRQKSEIGRLSAYCGVVCAATGAIAGIGYLNGDTYEVIAQSIVNSIGCIGGMVCDGAKSSCADKIAVALQCAFLGYDLACAGAGFQSGEGIVKDGVEETIDSVGRMARRGMQETNREILEIMMD